jgi:hypothetical protein
MSESEQFLFANKHFKKTVTLLAYATVVAMHGMKKPIATLQ